MANGTSPQLLPSIQAGLAAGDQIRRRSGPAYTRWVTHRYTWMVAEITQMSQEGATIPDQTAEESREPQEE